LRKVFLDDLPHGGSRYVPNNRVNWQQSIGYKINFIYGDMNGELKIIDYDKSKSRLSVIYQNEEKSIFTGHLSEGKLGSIIGKVTRHHLHEVGDILNVKSGKIEIIKQRKVNMGNEMIRGYDYKCLNCGHLNHISEGHLKGKLGCPVCMGQKIKVGLNDMWTTNPELAKLLFNPDDGYKFMQSSNLKLDWKCSECGNIIKNRQVSQIKLQGLSCPKCSDGISYPEKFMFNLLCQLNCEFSSQEIFNWSKNRRYDFYVPTLNCIIETHGIQHYGGGFHTYGGRSLEEEQENDKLKKELAIENGIAHDHYIVIDCRKSELEWIKNNILKSKLIKHFDFNKINWLKCHEFACSSLVKIACDLWTSGIHSTTLIGKQINLERGAVRRYLKQGVELGWCNYSIEKSRNYIGKQSGRAKEKKVICLNTKEVFDSISKASEKFNIKSSSGITSVCKGRYKTSGIDPSTGEKLKWMYKEDYEEYIKQAK
jgi:DNA-directed RNA polymerase subunit RPC12/RpoP